MQKGLNIRKKLNGEKSIQAAYSLNNIATFYTRQGKFGKAIPLFVETLEIRK